MTIRTKSAQNYVLPTREEMRAQADAVKLRRFCPSLVEDVCNLIAGGDYVPRSELTDLFCQEIAHSPKWGVDRDGDVCFRGKAVKIDGRYTKSRAEAARSLAQERANYHCNVQDFLRSLDLDNLPGNSPLEQAMGLLKLLSQQEGGSGGDDDDDGVLPIFQEGQEESPEQKAERINEVIDMAEDLDETEKELLGMENASTLEIATEMLRGKEHIIKVGQQVQKLAKFQRKPVRKFEPDEEGEHIQYRSMRDLGEVSRIGAMEFAYPNQYRAYRLATLEPVVKEKIRQVSRKIDVTILIDGSGSMDGSRFYRAGGVLMHLLKEVIEGTAELTIYFFDERLRKEFRATTPEEAKAVMEQVKSSNFQGGGTAIEKCVKAVIPKIWERVEGAEHLDKPELVIVTDGDDNCSRLLLSDLKGVKLHSFLVECNNQHLVNLARKSGGVGVSNL
jgi:von Willebrand factor type A domain